MQLTDFIADLTGLSTSDLFSGPTPLVVLSRDGTGNTTIDAWNVPGVAKPSAAQITSALADPSASKLSLITYAQNKQVTVRDGGMTATVGSAKIDVATDLTGRGLLAGAVQLAALAETDATFPWVNNDHTTVTLTKDQMTALGVSVGQYVQATYTVLGSILADVKAGKITTTAQIDAASWPSST